MHADCSVVPWISPARTRHISWMCSKSRPVQPSLLFHRPSSLAPMTTCQKYTRCACDMFPRIHPSLLRNSQGVTNSRQVAPARTHYPLPEPELPRPEHHCRSANILSLFRTYRCSPALPQHAEVPSRSQGTSARALPARTTSGPKTSHAPYGCASPMKIQGSPIKRWLMVASCAETVVHEPGCTRERMHQHPAWTCATPVDYVRRQRSCPPLITVSLAHSMPSRARGDTHEMGTLQHMRSLVPHHTRHTRHTRHTLNRIKTTPNNLEVLPCTRH